MTSSYKPYFQPQTGSTAIPTTLVTTQGKGSFQSRCSSKPKTDSSPCLGLIIFSAPWTPPGHATASFAFIHAILSVNSHLHSSMRFYTATKFCTPGLIKSMAFGFREASDGCALIPQIFTQGFVFSVTQEHTFYSISWRAFAKLASFSSPMFILIKQRSCQWSTRHRPWHTQADPSRFIILQV